VKQLSPRIRARHAENLLSAIRMGMKTPLVELIRSPRPDYQFLRRLEKLKDWRKRTAQQMGVLSDVILPRDLLELIASRNPASLKELSQLMQTIPWRFTSYGEEIQQVIKE
jgi:ribonuclease D